MQCMVCVCVHACMRGCVRARVCMCVSEGCMCWLVCVRVCIMYMCVAYMYTYA